VTYDDVVLGLGVWGCAAAHRLAQRAGAELHFEEPVTHWEEGRVTTARAAYEAEHIVVCPGPWAPELLGDLEIPFEVERQVQFYFTPK
jgi:sarcosine oxidase